MGYPERDVGKKKREQNCLGGILSIGFSQCICVLCSFNLFSFTNSLAQSLHVKFDCYFQSLKHEILRLQPIILFSIFSHSKQLNPLLPHFLHPLYNFQFIIFQCSDQNSKKKLCLLAVWLMHVERTVNQMHSCNHK